MEPDCLKIAKAMNVGSPSFITELDVVVGMMNERTIKYLPNAALYVAILKMAH